MEDFRRQFLAETAEKLENLRQNLHAQNLSSEEKRELMRVLHTIKGTAQTFGYDATSRLAHDLETAIGVNGNGQNVIAEGIELLQKSLTDGKFQLSEAFRKKLQTNISGKTADDSCENSAKIPVEFYSQLSNREKEMINNAVRGGKNLTVLETVFELANFANELINFREILSSSGEIVATFPSTRFAAHGKIGFQFLTAGLENPQNLTAEKDVHLIWESSITNLDAILDQIIEHGREIALKLNKQIEFERESGEINLSDDELKIVFESLLHLVRNAVDHAIEQTGTIKIKLKNEANDLHLFVIDDGRGIDLKLIKAKAIEKNLISADESLSENELLELIFQPELSTKPKITEISGRGIGLDTVKNSVERTGGKIFVKTETGKGTKFEIFLPHKKS